MAEYLDFFRVVNFVYTDLRIFYCCIPSCCISLYTLNYVEHGEHETKVLQTKVLQSASKISNKTCTVLDNND